MKIEAKIFETILHKLSLDGNNMETILEFKEDGMFARSIDPANIVLTEVILQKSRFKDYKAIGNLGVTNLVELRDFLKRFPKEVSVEKQNNLLVIRGVDSEKEGIFPLPADEFVKAAPALPDMAARHTVTSKMPCELLKEVQDDAKTSGRAEVFFTASPGQIVITTGDKNSKQFKTVHKDALLKSSGVVAVGGTFANIPKVLSREVTISFGENVPMIIEEAEEGARLKIMIAPFIPD
jgi:hypothetical protein